MNILIHFSANVGTIGTYALPNFKIPKIDTIRSHLFSINRTIHNYAFTPIFCSLIASIILHQLQNSEESAGVESINVDEIKGTDTLTRAEERLVSMQLDNPLNSINNMDIQV